MADIEQAADLSKFTQRLIEGNEKLPTLAIAPDLAQALEATDFVVLRDALFERMTQRVLPSSAHAESSTLDKIQITLALNRFFEELPSVNTKLMSGLYSVYEVTLSLPHWQSEEQLAFCLALANGAVGKISEGRGTDWANQESLSQEPLTKISFTQSAQERIKRIEDRTPSLKELGFEIGFYASKLIEKAELKGSVDVDVMSKMVQLINTNPEHRNALISQVLEKFTDGPEFLTVSNMLVERFLQDIVAK